MNWTSAQKVIAVVIVVFCLILAVGIIQALGNSRNSSAATTISRYGEEGLRVGGKAVVRAEPDLVTVTLGHNSHGRKFGEAKEACDKVMGSIIAALKAHGIDSKDIQTVDYKLYPAWEGQTENSPGFRVWHLQNMIEVRIKKVNTAADVIDAAVDAGADQVQSVEFSVGNINKLRAQAREKAIKAAKEKAEQLAKLMGARVGRVVSIVDDSYQPKASWSGSNYSANYQVRSGEGSFFMNNSESVLSSGQIKVEAREDVVFALE